MTTNKSPKSERKSHRKMEKKQTRTKHHDAADAEDAVAEDVGNVRTNPVDDNVDQEKEAALAVMASPSQSNNDANDDDGHRKASESSSKKKKEKKKKHHRKEEEDDDDKEAEESPTKKETAVMVATKKSSEKKKSKRKRSHDDDDKEEEEEEGENEDNDVNDDNNKKESKRKLRILERQRLLQELPKVDPETGISFTKQQLRRMRKRLKRGLNPIETPREKHERVQHRAQEKKQEEEEWADMIVSSKREQNDDDDDDDEADDDNEEDDDMEQEDDEDEVVGDDQKKSSDIKTMPTADVHEESSVKQQQEQPRKKHSPGHKPVPSDYVCQACKNKHEPVHWIYDCPDKVTVRGTNKKTTKGIHDPDARKVFISGLPFDTKQGDITKLFASHKCGKVVHCRMIKFPDTGRCKGQAYVTLETEEQAQKACSLLSGIAISNEIAAADAADSKKKSTKQQPQRKEPLKLKVVKVLNRLETKKTQ